MIADAVKTSRRLGHVVVMPEISLSPKSGPDVYAHYVQNRLSIYLYARLLWEPDQEMTSLVSDWCQTVFGEAARPMADYYVAMDRAWTAMPIHATILGNALSAAPYLLTDKLRAEAAAAFASAEQHVPKIADAAGRERAAAALKRERALFNQWLDLYRTNTDVPRLNLPLLAAAGDFAQTACRPQELVTVARDTKGYSTRVRLAWTKEALLVKWTCEDRQIKELKAAASGRDGQVVEDDSVELVLSSGLTGETWHLAANAKGIQQDWRDSSVGVREDLWNPDWQASTRLAAGAWEAEMAIPFAALGHTPNANETWEARFLRHHGGRQGRSQIGATAPGKNHRETAPGLAKEAVGRPGLATTVFPNRETALLLFSSAPRTDRALLWWSGAPDREATRSAALVQEFTEAGWQLHLVASEEKLRAVDGRCDAYWFRHPHGPNKVPADYWEQQVIPAVKEGALAVFVSYWDIPLDQYFRDHSLRVKVVSCSGIPLAARTSTFIAPGDWSTKPHNLLGTLKTAITPAYGFVPADAAGWTVLATAPNGSGTPYPYLLARRYGKGLIVLGGDDIRLSPARMLENFLAYREREVRRDH